MDKKKQKFNITIIKNLLQDSLLEKKKKKSKMILFDYSNSFF